MNTPNSSEIVVHKFFVKVEDCPDFGEGTLHPVLSTYALAREAEWAGRLILLRMKKDDQEGIGTAITIEHLRAARVGQQVTINAELISFDGRKMIVSFVATTDGKTIATGNTGQALVSKAELNKIYNR